MVVADKKHIPELRFLEFSKSWDELTLQRVVDFIDSLHETPKQYVEEGFPMIRVADVKDSGLNLETCFKVTEEVYKHFTKRYMPNIGDIIFSRVGTCGESVLIDFSDDICLGQNIVLLKTKENFDFIFCYLKTSFVKNQVNKKVVGSSHKTLSLKDLKKITIGIPEPVEQQKIATFLSSVDDKLNKLRRKRELLETYKRGLTQKIFSQELRFTQDDGTAFPDWKSTEFGQVVSRGSEKIDPLETPKAIDLIELENIESGSGRIVNMQTTARQKSIKTQFVEGDILFGKLRPYLRKYARPDFSGVCSSEIWVLKSSTLHRGFLYFLIQTERFMQVANISSGSKMPRSDWGVVSSAVFEIPGHSEQQKIADFLSSIDKRTDAVTKQITQMETFKKGLLQKMFV